MAQQVYYSVCHARCFERLRTQLLTSVASLRRHNQTIPVCVVAYGGLPVGLRHALHKLGVSTHAMPEYRDYLRAIAPRRWPLFAGYPVLHKYLSLSEINCSGLSQLLYLDCDSYLLGDVANLFALYRDRDLYAREEPYSRRSPGGYNSDYLDEDLLKTLCERELSESIPPFNTGVILLNNDCWQRIAALRRVFLSYVWRFMTWMYLNPVADPARDLNSEMRADLGHIFDERDIRLALHFPSSNRWIVEEVALWITVGRIAGLSHDLLDSQYVAQGTEYTRDSSKLILAHYFSGNTQSFMGWVEQHVTVTTP